MIIKTDSAIYPTIEFKPDENDWVADITHEGGYLGITILKKALAPYSEEEAKGRALVKWGLTHILKDLQALIRQSNRILFALQRGIFKEGIINEDKCRFDPYVIIITSLQTINIDQPYINFEFELSNTCNSAVFMDDIYYDYSWATISPAITGSF